MLLHLFQFCPLHPRYKTSFLTGEIHTPHFKPRSREYLIVNVKRLCFLEVFLASVLFATVLGTIRMLKLKTGSKSGE